MNLIQWLNDNAGSTMAILTGVYVVATIFILRESRGNNRLQRTAIEQGIRFERARNRPYVVFAVQSELCTHSEHHSDVYYFAWAKNKGVSSAHNVSILTSPELNVRQGWGERHEEIYRTPAMLRKPISVLLPGEQIREYVGPARFVFEDNADDELSFEVTVTYSDIVGENYHDKFTINLAWQREHAYIEDVEAKNRHRLLQDVEKGTRALERLVHVLDSPDRSNLFTAVDPSTLDSTQIDLLRRLIDACNGDPAKVTFVVHNFVTGPEIHKLSSDKTEKIEGSVANVEYLCRVGALSGCYRDGMLRFNISPTAKTILHSRQHENGNSGSGILYLPPF
jgi:hypothetical protein